MLECVCFKLSTPTHSHSHSHSHSNGNSTEEEEDNTSVRSPNVSGEFYRAVQSHYVNEIRSVIEAPPQVHHLDDEDSHHRHVLSQLLKPDSHSVREALSKTKPKSNLTRLVSTYLDHSETTSDFCLRLCRIVHRARHLYSPLSDLLSVLPADAPPLSQPQCDRAYDLFLEFDRQENPFALSRPHQLRYCFSELKRDIRRCHSRTRVSRRAAAGCALCTIAAVAGTIVVPAVVAAHAAVGFSAFLASPLCVPRPRRRELAMLKQLDAVENGTLVVNDVDTIDSLVDRVQTSVEADKAYVRFALEMGRERHPVQEVLKQLRKNQPVFQQLLGDLEQHIYLCLCSVNMARHALLAEIRLHQTS